MKVSVIVPTVDWAWLVNLKGAGSIWCRGGPCSSVRGGACVWRSACAGGDNS